MDTSDLTVWLERQTSHSPPALVAWVESNEQTTLSYSVSVVTQSAAGVSTLRQGGRLTLQAHVPRALGTLGLSVHAPAQCRVTIALRQDNGNETTYDLPCGGSRESES